MDAAIYNEVDHMRSVSENVIMGQLCPIGTGVFDISMDDKREDTDAGKGECMLDKATPVLAHSKEMELFSLSSPMNTPGGRSPIPGITPHEDQVEHDFKASEESM